MKINQLPLRALQLLSLPFLLIAASCATQAHVTVKGLEVNTNSVPPATIKLSATLYLDRVPVTNVMYEEFLEQLQNSWSKKKSEKMLSYPRYGLDKDLVFERFNGSYFQYREAQYTDLDQMISNKLNLDNYIHLPIYRFQPAVTMNEAKAALFCKWRTDITNAVYAIKSKNASQRAKYPTKVVYRLPTKEEMVQAQNKLIRMKQFQLFQEQVLSFEGNVAQYREIQDSGFMTVYEIKEVAADGIHNPLFNRTLKSYKESEMQTRFRCICEVTP